MNVLNGVKVSRWRAGLLGIVLTGALAGSAFAAVSEITLDPTANLSPGRLHATLTGTVTCDAGTTAFLNGRIVQPRNASGGGGTSVQCAGTPQKYAIDVSTFDGVFKPGKANAEVSSFQCEQEPPFNCTQTFTDAQITLTR
jgi:hypothetical protein